MPFNVSTFYQYSFRDLVVQGIVLPCMDDIVILAKNESEAIERLKKVLQVSSDYGLPRANGQVERINRTIIPVLSKMSEADPNEMVQTCSFTTRSLKLNIPTKH
ncbi:hypothetical protein TNCV_1591981 [Trichonephila clavipes]|nr:hypothetical protein TNCV_1591981 [Trichonephila clavipes]